MQATQVQPTTRSRHRFWLWGGLVCLTAVVVVLVLFLVASRPAEPFAQLELADGRILQIEGVSYGTTHTIGKRSIVADRFGPWLPGKAKDFFRSKVPENTIELDQAALVVWVNAIDPITRTNVDCQGVRVELVDAHGDSFESSSHWFGGQTFWRVGHKFSCYPRDEAQLMLRVTPWEKDKATPITTKLKNPRVAKPDDWTGYLPPQTNSAERLDIVLSELKLVTSEERYWQASTRYYEPTWNLYQNGRLAAGWDKPEWTAEDPTGNRGKQLCPHWPVLRFSVTIYPLATNQDAAVSIAELPKIDLSTLTNRIWWNLPIDQPSTEILAMGVCPPGTQVFSEGAPDTNGPTMGPVRGGAPSGWTGRSQRVTPMKLKQWHGHYTPVPTFYLRAEALEGPNRLAVRLRDEQGRYWIAEPEPQGVRDGIHPFLIKVPEDVTSVTPEIVQLKPVQAEFMVQTGAKE